MTAAPPPGACMRRQKLTSAPVHNVQVDNMLAFVERSLSVSDAAEREALKASWKVCGTCKTLKP